jgi:hypothetical protein
MVSTPKDALKIILPYNKWDEDRQTEEGCAKIVFLYGTPNDHYVGDDGVCDKAIR